MISILVPTRGRPERFAAMVKSARETASGKIEIVAVFDDDDRTKGEYDLKNITSISVPHRQDMSGLWNVAWNYATGDVAMMCGDDVLFGTKAWDAMVESTFSTVPDKVLMVYGNDGSQRQAPTLPFVTREWIAQAGEFTPDHLQGWFADEWIWSIAAELGRVIYLRDVLFRHEQRGDDATYQAGQKRRLELGGIDAMRSEFYSPHEVEQRDMRVARLRMIMDNNVELLSPGIGEWFHQSKTWAQQAREKLPNPRTLVAIHCWTGDQELVQWTLPIHHRHKRPIVVLSPEDGPANIDDPMVTNVHLGPRGYYGQKSLDRQRAHLEYLLAQPYDYFLLNDADSMCLSPIIPRYLYLPENKGVLWSNEVSEWRPHSSPYPKIALHPPYFAHRSVLERLVSVADKPEVKAHPITPYIDWYMLALAEEAGVEHRSFPDGASFPAWRRNEIQETQKLGHNFKHEYENDGKILGDVTMRNCVRRGAVLIHSVKHKPVLDMLVAEYDLMHGASFEQRELVSILVPFRPEKKDVWRKRNWKWIEQRWRAQWPDAEIIVGTDDGEEPFSKCQAVNDAYRKSHGDVLVVADADAYLDPEPLANAIQAARQTGRLVIPWRQILRLSEEDTKKLLRRKPATDFVPDQDHFDRAYPTPVPETAGTLFVIRTDAFERVQGMDPRFRGWGHEDVAFARACHTILGPSLYGPDTVVSLYHPRPETPKGRIWDNDDGQRNLPLAQAYVIAYMSPWRMQTLVDEHPLDGPARVIRRPQPQTEAIRVREFMAATQEDTIRIPLDV